MIAARVAAQLADDPDVRVTRSAGGLGELRVSVDGTDVLDTKWYPSPSSVTERVRAYLRDRASGG